MKKAFTLVELLVVVAIMALLGTAAVNGYRAMQRGIEERGAMENVNQFVRAAYHRAQIDRQPVSVYFWNETLREENVEGTETLVVVGRAVAVRQSGRISDMLGNYLYDEFGDLRFMRLTRDEGDEQEEDITGSGSTTEGNGMFLYHMGSQDQGFRRSIVSQTTKLTSPSRERMVTAGGRASIEAYAFVIMDKNGVEWKRGDAYGFEFAEIELPHNFIFGSTYSRKTANPVTDIAVLKFKVSGNSGSGARGGLDGAGTIEINCLRPGDKGELETKLVGTTENPTRQMN